MQLQFSALSSSVKKNPVSAKAYRKMSKRCGVRLNAKNWVAIYQSKHYAVVGIKAVGKSDVILGIARREEVDVFDEFHGLCIAWGKALRNFDRWA